MSNETPRRTRCSRYSTRVNGWVARSLNVSIRWLGIRNVFSSPRASTTTRRWTEVVLPGGTGGVAVSA